MMDLNDILVDVESLAKRNYFIPSYQRGYRWEKQQISELLNDINDFSNDSGEQEYYCLQPIVVKRIKTSDVSDEANGHEWYEVIDGQQRLTTLALILHYFNEQFVGKAKISEPKITYETRDTFIHKLCIDDNTNLSCCENEDKDSNIDLYHVVNAYQIIHDWFREERTPDLDTNKIQSALRHNVKVIWYEVDETNDNSSDAIELFTRINMGKIPLTNAELIKALFLRKRNFDEKNKDLRQIEIAKEWDSMEYALQNDDFWYFLNKDAENKPARIEYIFDMMFKKEQGCAAEKCELESFNKKYGTDDYRTFRFFANKLPHHGIKECWEDVQNCFSAIKEWFDDPVYYHYIGYLIYCGVSIVDIFTMYDDSPKDKFIQKVVDKIKETVKDINYSIDEDVVSFDLDYNNNKDLIRKLLLLFNIQYMIIHNSKADHWYVRFPFDLYKKQKWDIEHINSFTTYEITKREEQIKWIDIALDDLKNLRIDIQNEDTSLYNDIEQFRLNTTKNIFPSIKTRIAKLAGEDTDEDEAVKNNIGNLTLLNSDINRGYGNSLFVTKRKQIISKDKEGCFIPICTKNVFLKYYDTEGSTKTIWSKKNGDHAKYLSEIRETLKGFINNEAN